MRRLTQSERVHLEANRRARLEQTVRDSPGKNGGFRWALSIPEDIYPLLLKINPDLGCPNGAVKKRAWNKFIQSPYSDAFKVREKI